MRLQLKKILTWLLVIVVFSLVFKYIDKAQKQARFTVVNQTEEITLTRLQGHYYWPGTINDRKLFFLVDSGATSTAISQSFANRAVPKPWKVVGNTMVATANGRVQVKIIEIDLKLDGGLNIDKLRVTVLPSMEHDGALLGMDVLGKVELIQRGDNMRVRFVDFNE